MRMRTLLLGLCVVLLAACAGSVTLVGVVPSAAIAPTATLTAAPLPTLTSTPIPRPAPHTASILPLDQPWLLIDGVGLCSLSRDGALTLLDTPVRSVIQRFGKPPVLVSGQYGGTTTLIEPLHWRRIPLPLEPSGNESDWIASPDGQRIAAFVSQKDEDKAPQILTVDVQTGDSSSFPLAPSENEEQVWVDFGGFIGWSGDFLYTIQYLSATGKFQRIDLAHPERPAEFVHIVGYLGPWDAQRSGDTLVTRYAYDMKQSKLVDQRTGTERTFDPLAASGTFSPDGSRLVYTAYLTRTNQTELRFYDPASDAQGVLRTLAGKWSWMAQEGATWPENSALWSADGKQMLLFELDPPKGRQAHIALLTREGVTVAEVTPPIHAAPLAILPGDQLLTTGRRNLLVEALPLLPGASPSYPAILLPAQIGLSSIVYVPPAP